MPVHAEQLKACRLFAGFTDNGLEAFAQIARPREVPKGLSVYMAGTSGDGLFIIARGKVQVLAAQTNDVLAVLEAGESFGEMALLRAGPRTVTVRALETTRLVEIRRQDFNEILKQKPQACVKLLLAVFAEVEARLREVQPQLLGLA